MKSETKIFLEKDDALETVIGHLEMSPAETVTINIPKNSLLAQSAGNFRTLKKISEKTGKELFIESVDERVLEFAEGAKIRGVNPVFRAREKITDIIPEKHFQSAVRSDGNDDEEETASSSGRVAWFFGIFVILILFGFGAFQLTTKMLPKATVTFVLKKVNIPFEEVIEVSSKVSQTDIGNDDRIIIPGELFTAKKNLEMKFAASGTKKTAVKATGILTVFNAFSAEPQALVATTRFETPDGKIFRLDDKVIVPSARVAGGKITPSSVDVTVTAAEAGETYNVPPISLWRIPGFKGTPRYEGFYAKSSRPMSGGFIGEAATYADTDLKNAKTAIQKSLKDALEGYMRVTLKTNLKLLDGATSFEVIKEEPQLPENDPAHFSIFAEGQMKNLVFDEKTARDALIAKVRKTIDPDTRTKQFTVTYQAPTEANLSAGKMIFTAKGDVTFESNINTASLKSKLYGFDERQFRELVFAFPGLQKANLSLWPFWVRRIPTNAEKVEVITE